MPGCMGWGLIGVAVVAGLVALIMVPHNLRAYRARRAYRSLPRSAIDQVLMRIEQEAARRPAVTYLRLCEESPVDESLMVESHVGGMPYAEAGEAWPEGTPEGPPKFLLQVRLDEPSLGAIWQGRLIVAFLVFDFEQCVRSYAAPTLDRFVALESPEPPRPCIRLQHVAIPAESVDEMTPLSPRMLCEEIPEIRSILEPYSRDIEGMVAQILYPRGYGYSLDTSDIAYVGGDPALIQGPHEPDCARCGRPMRFLFQFGEIVPGIQMADGGVYTVYGCDEHPETCVGFVDTW